MSLTLRVLREADQEVDHAVDHYELESPGTGRRFLNHYLALLERVQQFPQSGSRLRDHDVEGCEIRSFVVSGVFPYTVFVAIIPREIVILAVAHQHREPGYWAERVGNIGDSQER